jgi:hypothetical protein
MRRVTLSVLFIFVFCAMSWAGEPDILMLKNFPFEQDPAPDWVQDNGATVSTLDPVNPHYGKGCFHVDMGKKNGTLCYYRYGLNLPVLKEPRARTVRVTVWVRTRDVRSGDISILFLKSYGPGRYSEWLYPKYPVPRDSRDNRFMILPASSEWTKVQGEGLVDPDARGVMIYLSVGNRSGKAQVWLDDMTVELLDRGLMFQNDTLGNIYPGEKNKMNLVISSPQKVISGRVRLFDEEDRLVGTAAITPGTVRFPVDLATRGYYDIQAEVSYSDGVRSEIRTTSAVVGPYIPEELRRKSPFGICCGDRGDLFRLSGARFDRTFYNWLGEDLKKAALAGFPANLKPVSSFGVMKDRDTVFCFHAQPEWFQDRKGKSFPSGQTFYCPPKDWNQFEKLVRYAVRAIDGKVAYIEVANEPDSWQGSWAELVRYHEVMARAVKSVDPKIKFMGPDFCSIYMQNVKAMVEAGLLKYIDVFSIHPYVNATAPEGEFIRKVRELKSYLASVGRKDLPIYLSEYGWTLPPGDWQKPVDPLTQARYVSRSSILLVAEQIDAFIYFLAMGQENWGYGVLNYWDSSPLPGFSAFANAARMLTGVKGPGRNLNLTPTTWMTLFRKGSGTLAAVWDVNGSSAAFVPKPWSAARDMMGRPVKESADGTIAVSPSPIFIEIPNPGFYQIAMTQTVEVTRGGTVPFAWKPAWVPSPLKIEGGRLQVPETTPKGEYLILSKTSTGWSSVKVKVKVNLEIESAELLWPKNETAPKLRVKIRSNLDKPMPVSEKCKLTGLSEVDHSGQILPPNTVTEQILPLPKLEPAKRYQGEFIVDAINTHSPVRGQIPLDLTVVPCGPDLSKSPVMDISAWEPFDASYKTVVPFSSEDCSATLQTGYDDQGLHFRVAVRDNIHQQTWDGKGMWNEDSIQFGFDLDADKPWQANIGGCNGHFRIIEYGLALGQSGPMTWRWISYFKELPSDVEDKRVKADITRQGTQTIYRITFPWSTLGLAGKPAAGSRIGFSLVVNDTDPNVPRHGLRLFSGIVETKDPARFGNLWLR